MSDELEKEIKEKIQDDPSKTMGLCCTAAAVLSIEILQQF